jgi:hypothetical protein
MPSYLIIALGRHQLLISRRPSCGITAEMDRSCGKLAQQADQVW